MFSIGQRTYLQLRPSEAMDVTQSVEGQVQRAVDVGLTPWCGKGFLFQATESTFKRRLSYSVCAVLVCSCTQSTAVHMSVRTPKHWQPYYCLDTRRYCTR